MNKNLVVGIVVILVLVGGFFLFNYEDSEETEVIDTLGNAEISIQNGGYVPSVLQISLGDSVTWTNEGTRANWPASNVHPTHEGYPDSGLDKCGTEDEEGIFDACKALEVGESWTFTFNEVGDWRYHDHTRAGLVGKIIVK
jgi:plastocyanin